MARQAINGWDYFSLSCSFASNDRAIYFRDKSGHISLLIWILLQADLFAVGVCYKWDGPAKYSFMSRHKISEKELNKAIEGMFQARLLDREVYEKTGLLTSRHIQEQGLVMARASKRRVIRCPKNVWLLGNCLRDEEKLRIELTKEKVKERKVKERKVKESKVKESKASGGNVPNVSETIPPKKKTTPSVEIPISIKAPFEEWLEYRRQIKKRLTDLSIKKLVEKWKNKPKEFQVAVDHTIEHGWIGLQEPDKNGNGYTNQKTKEQKDRQKRSDENLKSWGVENDERRI